MVYGILCIQCTIIMQTKFCIFQATVVCDLVLLYLLPKREFYKNMKFKHTGAQVRSFLDPVYKSMLNVLAVFQVRQFEHKMAAERDFITAVRRQSISAVLVYLQPVGCLRFLQDSFKTTHTYMFSEHLKLNHLCTAQMHRFSLPSCSDSPPPPPFTS